LPIPGVAARQLDRVNPALFLFSPPQGPAGRPDQIPQTQRLNAAPGPFGPLFRCSGRPVSRQTNPRSAPRPADGELVWNPCGSVRRDQT